MMKIQKSIFYLLVFSSLILSQPVYAALVASLEQRTITIDRFENDEKIIALDGTVFEVISPDLKQRVKSFYKQQVHILYVQDGERFVLSELKSATEPLFIIPMTLEKKKQTPK